MRSLAVLAGLFLAGCSSDPETPESVSQGAAAHADWRDGRLEAARDGYVAALEEDRFSVDASGAMKHLNNLGVIALHEGDLVAAGDHFGAAIELSHVGGAEADRMRLRLQLTCVFLRSSDLEHAQLELEKSKAWAEDEGGADLCQHLCLQASLRLRLNDAAGAATLARRGLKEADDDDGMAAAALVLGRALEIDPKAARAAFGEGLDAARRAGHLPLAVDCLLGLSRSWEGEDRDAARRFATLALEAAKSRKWKAGIARSEGQLDRLR